jgi:hypothetical protein
MKSYVVRTRSIINGNEVPGGTTITVADDFVAGPNLLPASPPAPALPAPPTAEQQFAALAARIAVLETQMAALQARDRQWVAAVEKIDG